MKGSSDSEIFPRTINFVRDPIELTFNSIADFKAWQEKERQFWQSFAMGGPFGQEINQNIQWVTNQNSTDISSFSSSIEDFTRRYLPSEARFSRALARVREIYPQAAAVAASSFPNPQIMQSAGGLAK